MKNCASFLIGSSLNGRFNASVAGCVMNTPQVSIVIAAYNAENYIETAINSVLAENNVSLEILVVDDCSSDSTAEIVNCLASVESRIRYFRNDVNGGPSCSRNIGIREASGDWIAVLDADDEFRSGRLSCLLELASDTDAELVCDYLRPVDEQGHVLDGIAMFPIAGRGEYAILTAYDFIQADMPGIAGLKAGYLKPVINRRFLRHHGIRYDEAVRVGEDALLLFECLMKGVRAAVTKRPMYDYRFTNDSITRQLTNNNFDTLLEVNTKMIQMTSAEDNKLLIGLLEERESLYGCAKAYESLVRAFKKNKSILDAASVGLSRVRCFGYFTRTIFQRFKIRAGISRAR